MTDFGGHAHEVAGVDSQAVRVGGVYPDRVAVGNFIQPFGIARAGVV